MRAVVVVEGDLTMRAAHSLLTHDAVEEVSILGPSGSNSFEVVESVTGHDVVVGGEQAVAMARDHQLPVVTSASLRIPGVEECSPAGLALSLAVGIEGLETVAIAVPGEDVTGQAVTFPSPIDARSGGVREFQSHPVIVAPGEGTLAAAMAVGTKTHRVVLDDHSFMGGVALAAGVAVYAALGPVDGPVPVWTQSAAYLRAATQMGLVLGERPAAA